MAILFGKTLVCAACGSDFHPHTKARHKKPQRFCSQLCGRRSRELKDPLKRFWTKVDKSKGDTGCWNWTASVNRYGYGAFGLTPQDIRFAHRYAWELLVGPIPAEECLLHSCDNPRCVNPAHLRVGNRTENAGDKVLRGRVPKGSTAPNAKLTEDNVVAIRADKRSQAAIARDYGVNQSTIHAIKRRVNWKHVP